MLVKKTPVVLKAGQKIPPGMVRTIIRLAIPKGVVKKPAKRAATKKKAPKRRVGTKKKPATRKGKYANVTARKPRKKKTYPPESMPGVPLGYTL